MKFGVGVLGATGYIGTPYRAEMRDSTDDCNIVALCARRVPLLEEAGKLDGATLITTNWREVIEHPDVNLVMVATPDALHINEVLACVEAGKHIFCEKPIGMNADEAQQMWDAVKDSGLAHFVPFWTRYVPVFVEAKKRIPSLGIIKAMVYRWHNPRPMAMPFTWRDDAALSSAGSIADVGSHAYDTMRWMLGGEATRVLAHGDVITIAKPDLGEVNLDEALAWGGEHQAADSEFKKVGTAFDYASISFEFSHSPGYGDSIAGTLVLSHAPYIRKGFSPEVEIHGTEGSLAIDRINSQLTQVTVDSPDPEVIKVDDPGFGNRFAKHVFPGLRARLEGKGEEYPGIDDGCKVQLFTDAAARSAREGKWVTIE